MLAAIEIYNKPQIEYRDECFTILLVNAWELLVKAILSKNKQRVYYPKKRGKPYRTYSVQDALRKAKPYFPADIPYQPVAANLSQLIAYRDKTIHFYNQRGFGVVIYGLAQTSIVNFRDLMLGVFGIDIAGDMTLSLLPLSFGAQPDPIAFLQQAKATPPKSRAVAQFLREISQATHELESRGLDTARFLTVFTVNLRSVKHVSSADVTVALSGVQDDGDTPLVIVRRVDLNVSHPLRQKDIVAKLGPELAGVPFTAFTFQALARKLGIKSKPHLCWQSNTGDLTRYSAEVPSRLGRLTEDEIREARKEYSEHIRQRRRQRACKA